MLTCFRMLPLDTNDKRENVKLCMAHLVHGLGGVQLRMRWATSTLLYKIFVMLCHPGETRFLLPWSLTTARHLHAVKTFAMCGKSCFRFRANCTTINNRCQHYGSWAQALNTSLGRACLNEAAVFERTFVEEWVAKFDFYMHWPYKLLRIFAGYITGDLALAKRTANEFVEWFTALPDKSLCHRSVRPLMDPGSATVDQLQVFIRSDLALHSFNILFAELLPYAAAQLTERRLEGQHARIGQQDLTSMKAGKAPATICAEWRRDTVLHLLGRDDFLSFLQQKWGTNIWLELLAHCMSETEIKFYSSWTSKLWARVYSYDTSSLFDNAADAKALTNSWSKYVTQVLYVPCLPCTEGQSLVVNFLKSILEPGRFFPCLFWTLVLYLLERQMLHQRSRTSPIS